MPSGRDSFRRNRVAPVGTIIIAPRTDQAAPEQTMRSESGAVHTPSAATRSNRMVYRPLASAFAGVA
jgi:hypothetical protein